MLITSLINSQTTEYEDYTLISTPTNERDLQRLLDFVRGLMPSTNQSTSRKASINTSDTASVDSDSPLENDKENSNNAEVREILEIVSNPSNRKFFLDNLMKSKDPANDIYEVRLKTSQFNVLTEIMLKLIKGKDSESTTKSIYYDYFIDMGVEEDVESLYTILNICTKFYHKVAEPYFVRSLTMSFN